MQFTLSINQTKSLEWNLNAQQAMLFSFVYECPSWCKPVTKDETVYYAISKQKIIDELPLLTDKPDTAYRLLKQLEAKGVLEVSSTSNITLIRLTDMGKTWNHDRKGSEKYPSKGRKNFRGKVGKISEVGRKNIREGSEKSPTNQDTSNQDTSNQRAEAANASISASESTATITVEETPADSTENLPDHVKRIFDTALEAPEPPESDRPDNKTNRRRFAMHWEWEPGSSFNERCKMAGIVLSGIQAEQAGEILGEFRSYWEARSDELTQSEWEHKLLSHLRRTTMTNHQQAGSLANATDNRERRRAVSAALMDVHNTDW